MRRIALGVEYDGTPFRGFQIQKSAPTVQMHLHVALEKIGCESVYLHCAGRTDAGVHAVGQVVHFDTRAKRHLDAWVFGVNSYLPSEITVNWARSVDFHFHARFSALARRYCYVIYNHPVRPAILHSKVSWCYYPLDHERMHESAQFLIGEHDFSSFRSSECQSKTPMRSIRWIHIRRHGHYVLIEIEANAFLHHMVRNIAGVLIKIGSGQRDLMWMKEVLDCKNRRMAAETAPASGLYLTEITYPEAYRFPRSASMFLL